MGTFVFDEIEMSQRMLKVCWQTIDEWMNEWMMKKFFFIECQSENQIMKNQRKHTIIVIITIHHLPRQNVPLFMGWVRWRGRRGKEVVKRWKKTTIISLPYVVYSRCMLFMVSIGIYIRNILFSDIFLFSRKTL